MDSPWHHVFSSSEEMASWCRTKNPGLIAKMLVMSKEWAARKL